MAKKIQIKGVVPIPSDVAEQVLDDNPAEFKKIQRPRQFHDKKSVCYLVQASLRYDGHDYFVAQKLGSSDLTMGYAAQDCEPDLPTQRQLRKIIAEKYF